MKEGKIGVQETICFIVIAITVKAYFTSPAYIAQATGTSSWYVTLISATTALIAFIIICWLFKRFPGKDFITIFKESLGKFFGTIFSLVLCGFFIINNSLLLREFSEVLRIYILPSTPISLVMGTLTLTAVTINFLGFEAIVRFAKLMAYLLLAGFITVIILNYNHYDFYNLFPIQGYGLKNVAFHGFSRSSFYSEVILLGVLAPSLQGISHIKKIGVTSIIISGLITSLSLMTTMMALNYATAQETASRLYELTRIINRGGFLQRLDPLFIFPWSIGSIISFTGVFYISVSTYCKSFNIQDIRPTLAPFGIIIFTLSMVPKDFTSLIGYVQITRQNGWIIAFGLPIFVLIVSILRKKGV